GSEYSRRRFINGSGADFGLKRWSRDRLGSRGKFPLIPDREARPLSSSLHGSIHVERRRENAVGSAFATTIMNSNNCRSPTIASAWLYAPSSWMFPNGFGLVPM